MSKGLFSIIIACLTLPTSSVFGSSVFIPVGGEEIDFTYNGVPFGEYVDLDVVRAFDDTITQRRLDLNGYIAERIYIIQWAAFATHYPTGVTAGYFVVNYTDGTSSTLHLVMGVNTAEWAYDRPENQPILRHAKISPAQSSITEPDEYSDYYYLGHSFCASIDTELKPISHVSLILSDAWMPNDWLAIGVSAITLEVPSAIELESIEVINGVLIRNIPSQIWSKDDPETLHPFAASMKQIRAKLHFVLSHVRDDRYTPTVTCEYSWEPNNTSLTRLYSDQFDGWEGDIDILIPQSVGKYVLSLTIKVSQGVREVYSKTISDLAGEDITAYITLDKPVGPLVTKYPSVLYLDKASKWARGAVDQEDIFIKLVHGIYNDGRSSGWQYKPIKTSWAALLSNAIKYGDCQTMAELWVAMANTLGVRGVSTYYTRGSHKYGFLTVSPAKTFDNQPGNAHPFGSPNDRWCFNNHYVGKSPGRSRANNSIVYYDPTVNNTYDLLFSNLIERNLHSALLRHYN